VLRRSLRTQITTKVVALSAAAAILLGAALVTLIVAVTGQRDAARVAFRSQQALGLANQLEKSLLSIESGLNRYVMTREPRYLATAKRELAEYPDATRRLAGLVSDDAGQQASVAKLSDAIKDYDQFWATSLIEIVSEDGFEGARSQVETNGGRARLDGVRAQFESLFNRERAVIRAREQAAERGSARAIGLGVGGLVSVIAIALGFTLYLRRSVLARSAPSPTPRAGSPPATCRRACPPTARTSSASSLAASTRWPTRWSAGARSSSTRTSS
jgi:two-component system chemotaxis sensor kinase CheA